MKHSLYLSITAILLAGFTGCTGSIPPVTTSPQNSTSTPVTLSQTTQTTQTKAPGTTIITIPVTVPATTPATTTATTTGIPDPVNAAFYPINQTVQVDLDGDGKNEEIVYEATDLRINGKSYADLIGDNVFMNEPNQEHFLIVDLNSTDPSKEIGLLVDGPSDDYETFFFRYTNPNELMELGSVPVIMGEDLTRVFDGKGHIFGNKRLSVLQTWFAPARWKLEGYSIYMDPDDIYYPVRFGFEQPIKLKVDLPIYEKMGDATPKTTLKPQEVEFLATDNSNWCQIKGKDGTTGWFKFHLNDHLMDVDKDINEVFDNLVIAD